MGLFSRLWPLFSHHPPHAPASSTDAPRPLPAQPGAGGQVPAATTAPEVQKHPRSSPHSGRGTLKLAASSLPFHRGKNPSQIHVQPPPPPPGGRQTDDVSTRAGDELNQAPQPGGLGPSNRQRLKRVKHHSAPGHSFHGSVQSLFMSARQRRARQTQSLHVDASTFSSTDMAPLPEKGTANMALSSSISGRIEGSLKEEEEWPNDTKNTDRTMDHKKKEDVEEIITAKGKCEETKEEEGIAEHNEAADPGPTYGMRDAATLSQVKIDEAAPTLPPLDISPLASQNPSHLSQEDAVDGNQEERDGNEPLSTTSFLSNHDHDLPAASLLSENDRVKSTLLAEKSPQGALSSRPGAWGASDAHCEEEARHREAARQKQISLQAFLHQRRHWHPQFNMDEFAGSQTLPVEDADHKTRDAVPHGERKSGESFNKMLRFENTGQLTPHALDLTLPADPPPKKTANKEEPITAQDKLNQFPRVDDAVGTAPQASRRSSPALTVGSHKSEKVPSVHLPWRGSHRKNGSHTSHVSWTYQSLRLSRGKDKGKSAQEMDQNQERHDGVNKDTDKDDVIPNSKDHTHLDSPASQSPEQVETGSREEEPEAPHLLGLGIIPQASLAESMRDLIYDPIRPSDASRPPDTLDWYHNNAQLDDTPQTTSTYIPTVPLQTLLNEHKHSCSSLSRGQDISQNLAVPKAPGRPRVPSGHKLVSSSVPLYHPASDNDRSPREAFDVSEAPDASQAIEAPEVTETSSHFISPEGHEVVGSIPHPQEIGKPQADQPVQTRAAQLLGELSGASMKAEISEETSRPASVIGGDEPTKNLTSLNTPEMPQRTSGLSMASRQELEQPHSSNKTDPAEREAHSNVATEVDRETRPELGPKAEPTLESAVSETRSRLNELQDVNQPTSVHGAQQEERGAAPAFENAAHDVPSLPENPLLAASGSSKPMMESTLPKDVSDTSANRSTSGTPELTGPAETQDAHTTDPTPKADQVVDLAPTVTSQKKNAPVMSATDPQSLQFAASPATIVPKGVAGPPISKAGTEINTRAAPSDSPSPPKVALPSVLARAPAAIREAYLAQQASRSPMPHSKVSSHRSIPAPASIATPDPASVNKSLLPSVAASTHQGAAETIPAPVASKTPAPTSLRADSEMPPSEPESIAPTTTGSMTVLQPQVEVESESKNESSNESKIEGHPTSKPPVSPVGDLTSANTEGDITSDNSSSQLPSDPAFKATSEPKMTAELDSSARPKPPSELESTPEPEPHPEFQMKAKLELPSEPKTAPASAAASELEAESTTGPEPSMKQGSADQQSDESSVLVPHQSTDQPAAVYIDRATDVAAGQDGHDGQDGQDGQDTISHTHDSAQPSAEEPVTSTASPAPQIEGDADAGEDTTAGATAKATGQAQGFVPASEKTPVNYPETGPSQERTDSPSSSGNDVTTHDQKTDAEALSLSTSQSPLTCRPAKSLPSEGKGDLKEQKEDIIFTSASSATPEAKTIDETSARKQENEGLESIPPAPKIRPATATFTPSSTASSNLCNVGDPGQIKPSGHSHGDTAEAADPHVTPDTTTESALSSRPGSGDKTESVLPE